MSISVRSCLNQIRNYWYNISIMYKHNLRKRLILVIAPLIVTSLVCLVLYRTGVIFHKTAPITANSYTKGEPKNPTSGSQNSTTTEGTNSPQPGDQKSNSDNPAAISLLIPSGNFVSDHHPNLGGSPAPNTLTSVCVTTPGASCTITFINTNGDITKTLPAQVTDRGGATYWNWQMQTIGLTSGTWTIKATASLGNQTKTATDPMQLTVSP